MHRLAKLCLVLALVLPSAACLTMNHTVGNGGAGTAQSSHRQWFVLWGLIPINEKDSQDMAGGATDYTVVTERDVLDVVLNIFTGLLSFVSQTQTVTR